MRHILQFFIKNSLLVNAITLAILVVGWMTWTVTKKEELPDITFNTISITTAYPGAAAADVEYDVTRPLELAVQGLDHVQRITSTSRSGASTIRIELDSVVGSEIDAVVTEIKNQVLAVDLPDEVLKEPRVRVFETTKKAIIDIAIYKPSEPLLTQDSRTQLQQVGQALSDRLTALPAVFQVTQSGYRLPQLRITVDPRQLNRYEVPLSQIVTEIQSSHIRQPAGTLRNDRQDHVSVLNELTTPEALGNVAIQGGFDSQLIRLNQVATITHDFEPSDDIIKVNGNQAIIYNVVKSTQFGILDSLTAVEAAVDEFKAHVTGVEVVLLDDESIDVKNRLSIIASNGIMGFVLIVLTLFLFLNKRSGFWVALGIPIALCITLIIGRQWGLTINGITLAAVIIVLGIVVDDAIVVAENITRKLQDGQPLRTAAYMGAREMVFPVLASVSTTCIAFLPLAFFSGRYGQFFKPIPIVIGLMLAASLIESFLLLPNHMMVGGEQAKSRTWFNRIETGYERLLTWLLDRRWVIYLFFFALLGAAIYVSTQSFKFVMFPREETRELVMSGHITSASTKEQTAVALSQFESELARYIGQEAIGFRTHIAQSRRGSVAQNNQFRITLEIVPATDRTKSADELVAEIEAMAKNYPELGAIRFAKSRWGQGSGQVFELIVQDDSDTQRAAVTDALVAALSKHPDIQHPEVDVPPTKTEYVLTINQAQLKRLSINPKTIAQTVRTIVEGRQLDTVFITNTEVAIIVGVNEAFSKSIDTILQVPIENRQGYLVPLSQLVTVKPVTVAQAIQRRDLKRASYVDADLNPESTQTPLEVAESIQKTLFPQIYKQFPTTQITFAGEVMESRESRKELVQSVLIAICLIYIILVLLFQSLIKPFRVMVAIPFGFLGVIMAFYVHGKTQVGFYAIIGTIGMIGVVVNDAIIMLNKLDKTVLDADRRSSAAVASVAKTRLRAIILTTITTVVGVMPTAYGLGGYDAMLSDMMIALGWGLIFGTIITLILVPGLFMTEVRWTSSWLALGRRLRQMVPVIIVGIITMPPLYAAGVIDRESFIQAATRHDQAFHVLLMDQLTFTHKQVIGSQPDEWVATILGEYEIARGAGESSTAKQTASLSRVVPRFGQTMTVTYTDPQAVQATFAQDIAQNAFGASQRINAQLTTIQLDLARFQLIEAYEDYLAQLLTRYYQWLEQFQSLKLAKSAVRESEQVLASIRRRQGKKVSDQTDVNKAHVQLINKQEQQVIYEREYEATTAWIKRSMGIQASTYIEPNSQLPTEALPQKTGETDRSLTMIQLIEQQAGWSVKQAYQSILPSIQLTGRWAQTSTDSDWFVGGQLAIPLTNRSAKATHELALINQNKAAVKAVQSLIDLRTVRDRLYRKLVFQRRLIDVAKTRQQLAESIRNAESENYSYGKASLNDYIDAVSRYDGARFDVVKKQIAFQQLLIEWQRLADQLIKETNPSKLQPNSDS